ncbi:hypothetical protein Ahy_A03g014811 [Arachis hypogaea]|uniref:CCHC-type domain-containing protein n=1 Tax=Arachis hypogaea TaxID=3818 RepID=A0A445DYN4_ARAHY|nr:hypothetical protein Ahy_A03g014811 [Arachis hypogaea]
MDQVRMVYRARFRPLGNPTTWPAYNVIKGRPKMTCFLKEMDTHMLHGPRQCRQCGVEGHSRSRCRQSEGASAGNNAQ